MTNVAEREDKFLVPQWDTCKMKRLIDFKLPVSSDVMKAVMSNRFLWEEFNTRIDKQLQELARKKAQVKSEIEDLEKSTIVRELQDLSLYKARLSIDIDMLKEYLIHVVNMKARERAMRRLKI